MKTLITLCTYNEVDNLRGLIPELLSLVPTANILVIDDNSPDGTGALVAEMAKRDDRVRLLSRLGKQGLGTATLAGFRYAIEHNYELLVNMDADFSHGPKYVPLLIAEAADYDVIIASRYMPGGGVAGWTFRRKLMSQTINFWARFWLGLKTADNSGSFRCFRVARLAEVDWDLTLARGYAFQEEILYRCRQVGCRMTEVPFIFEDRRFGVTKINLKECVVAVWVIFLLGLQRLLGYRVRK
ncbi:MAG: polyprenol monophosphomannose synthase [Planctomycetota bacterium]|nr:MAG: polyprenol monophosphomannose synthase [Planctomycetota bacterium]